MAANIERLAEKFSKKGYSEVAISLNAAAQVARKLGVQDQFTNAASVSGSPVEESVETSGEIPHCDLPPIAVEYYRRFGRPSFLLRWFLDM